MSVMGFLEPAAGTGAAGRLSVRGGLGPGIAVHGPVLEGRMSVRDAQLLNAADGVRGGGPFSSNLPTAKSMIVQAGPEWDQTAVDAFWAGRDSVFG